MPVFNEVAYANSLPLNIDQSSTVVIPDDRRDLSPRDFGRALKYQVSAGFFQTVGIRFLEGRDFTWQDTADSQSVGVVNEAFVRLILQDVRAIGRQVRFGHGAPVTIVGVVETGKYQTLTEAATPAIFQPMLQAPNTTTMILVRSTRPDAEIAEALRRAVQEADPALPLMGVRSVEDMLGFVRLPMQAAALALGAFGILAATLATTGIHGVVAYAVSRRRRELAFGLRWVRRGAASSNSFCGARSFSSPSGRWWAWCSSSLSALCSPACCMCRCQRQPGRGHWSPDWSRSSRLPLVRGRRGARSVSIQSPRLRRSEGKSMSTDVELGRRAG